MSSAPRTSRLEPAEPAEPAHRAPPQVDLAQVAHIAKLARLALTEDESRHIAADLERILGYVGELQSLDLRDIPPTSHPLPFTAPLRADVAAAPLDRAVALAGAPVKDPAGLAFIVPKVV